MKLWHSFLKELKISSKGFYFYVEIIMALILLVVIMFVIPENFEGKSKEYLHLNLPQAVQDVYLENFKELDSDGIIEDIIIKSKGEEYNSLYIETDEQNIYIINDFDDFYTIVENERPSAAVSISLDLLSSQYPTPIKYDYYTQGYESDRLLNLFRILHAESQEEILVTYDQIKVELLVKDVGTLSDRQNMLPVFLTFNGSLMGMFIISSYIYLDKNEGIIKAYAVTASKVRTYLLSKVGVLLVVSILTSLMLIVPVMGFKINYGMFLILLITSAFFASALGLLIASFFRGMIESFGVIYLVMMIMILPNIAYFISSWQPAFITWIPTYPLIQGFKEILIHGDYSYVLMVSAGFLLAGVLLFEYAHLRYKKNLAG